MVISVLAGAPALAETDADSRVRFGALVQGDGRFYQGDGAPPSTFLMRRVRPYFDGTFSDFIRVRFDADFGEGKVILYDAYVDLRGWDWLSVRAGRFSPSIGLELLRYPGNLVFVERGLPTALVPNRDVGLELRGELWSGRVRWAAGVFNGVPDGAMADADLNDAKDFDARLFVRPFRGLPSTLLDDFGVGLSGSSGVHRGTAEAPLLPSFKSMGQVTFFSYASGTIANGRHQRLAPQLFWTAGPFGALAEWTWSRQEVLNGQGAQLTHRARQVALSLLLTGERATYGAVTPSRPSGAFEIAARYNDLDVDPAAFPAFADPLKSARGARAVGAALNWYLSIHARLGIDFERTVFEGGGRPPENALFTRVQGTL